MLSFLNGERDLSMTSINEIVAHSTCIGRYEYDNDFDNVYYVIYEI